MFPWTSSWYLYQIKQGDVSVTRFSQRSLWIYFLKKHGNEVLKNNPRCVDLSSSGSHQTVDGVCTFHFSIIPPKLPFITQGSEWVFESIEEGPVVAQHWTSIFRCPTFPHLVTCVYRPKPMMTGDGSRFAEMFMSYSPTQQQFRLSGSSGKHFPGLVSWTLY